MDKAIEKYLHWFASYPSLVLFVCSILSLLMLGYCEPLLTEMTDPSRMPGLSTLILTRIPSYFCAAASIVLFLVCFQRKVKTTAASFVISYACSVLLMLATILSVLIPFISLRNSL